MLRRRGLTVVLLLALVGVWQGVSLFVSRLVLASPGETISAFGHNSSLLLDNARVTLEEILLGLAVSVLLGAGAALAMHLVRPLRDAAYPLLIASQAIPLVVIAPLLVVAFDYGIGPKV